MDEALQVGGGKGWAVFANSEVSRQPDMVVSFKDCPPSDLQHSQEIATTSRMKIESSLIRGDRRKWYCQNCGNDALPYKYPKHFV
ncbi:MAG: hypothetical protein KKD07_10765 [Candidatus Omnitrophica bacterium]|nr:hypothetical protein [Candidatus Omnitrophota bacterium]